MWKRVVPWFAVSFEVPTKHSLIDICPCSFLSTFVAQSCLLSLYYRWTTRRNINSRQEFAKMLQDVSRVWRGSMRCKLGKCSRHRGKATRNSIHATSTNENLRSWYPYHVVLRVPLICRANLSDNQIVNIGLYLESFELLIKERHQIKDKVATYLYKR